MPYDLPKQATKRNTSLISKMNQIIEQKKMFNSSDQNLSAFAIISFELFRNFGISAQL